MGISNNHCFRIELVLRNVGFGEERKTGVPPPPPLAKKQTLGQGRMTSRSGFELRLHVLSHMGCTCALESSSGFLGRPQRVRFWKHFGLKRLYKFF